MQYLQSIRDVICGKHPLNCCHDQSFCYLLKFVSRCSPPHKSKARQLFKEDVFRLTEEEAKSVESAKVGAVIGGGISLITNTFAVIKGEKNVEEAAADSAVDTVKSDATSYATGFANTALASAMKNGMVRSLEKANAPAYIIQAAISTVKSIARLCKGEIDTNEFFLEIKKNGMTLIVLVH